MQVKYLWIASEKCGSVQSCRWPVEIKSRKKLARPSARLARWRVRWTFLATAGPCSIRDLFYGRTRFKEFVASPEGIPTNILTDRLERLLARGIIEQIPAQDGTKRLAYRLTKKGKALGPLLKTMRDWGLAWDKSTRVLA